MKKAYIAARFALKKEVLSMYKKLKERGYEVSCDWTEHKPIKPFEKNRSLAVQYSSDDINGARNCDIFIIISDEAGTGMYVELGVALLSNMLFSRSKIYVIGKHNNRCMFYFLPIINVRDSFEDVLKEL